MFKHYLTIAWRTLMRRKGYSALNIGGLSLSLAGCLLIFLYVQNELTYDAYHAEAENIVRIVERLSDDMVWVPTDDKFAVEMQALYPEVVKFVHFEPKWGTDHHAQTVDKEFFIDRARLFWTNSSIFEVFDFELAVGDPSTVLRQPYSVVLTESTAQRYFGDADPIGQNLVLNKKETYTVTGILKNIRIDSHFTFDVLASHGDLGQAESFQWPYTYLLLAPGTDVTAFQQKVDAFFAEQRPDRVEEGAGLEVQRLLDIHLHSHYDYEAGINGNVVTVIALAIVGVLLLLIGGINFMNLATARATNRAKEVGVRKAIGGAQRHVLIQFLGESFFMTLLAVAGALVLVHAVLPAFNRLIEQTVHVPYELPLFWLVLVGLIAVVGIGAGSYPAFVLAAFQPRHVLKGKVSRQSGTYTIRRVLVVVQFSASIMLIVGTFVVVQQTRYMQNQTLGFDKEHVMGIRSAEHTSLALDPLRTQWMQHPNVQAVAKTVSLPTKFDWVSYNNVWTDVPANGTNMLVNATDFDYAYMLGVEVVAGRDFSRAFGGDTSRAALLNEAAVRALGWTPPEAIGKQVATRWSSTTIKLNVVGVIADFHDRSLHEPIPPMMHYLNVSYPWGYIALRMGSGDVRETVAYLKEQWATFHPDEPFTYFFLDTVFDAAYRADERMGSVMGAFAFLAVAVACLGLFGLVAFTTEQRTKEVGIRKVLGASELNLVVLLSKDFVSLVGVACIVAIPGAYMLMHRWLNEFSYRTTLGVDVFAGAAALAFIVTLLTVSYQAIKAARANPVEALRYE